MPGWRDLASGPRYTWAVINAGGPLQFYYNGKRVDSPTHDMPAAFVKLLTQPRATTLEHLKQNRGNAWFGMPDPKCPGKCGVTCSQSDDGAVAHFGNYWLRQVGADTCGCAASK